MRGPFAVLKQMLNDDGRQRLQEVLAAQGLALPMGEGEMAVRLAAQAVRRCVGCNQQARCDAVIASKDWQGLKEICPNSGYIALLAAAAR